MEPELVTVLRHLQKHGGSFVVQNPSELGLTRNAFAAAVHYLNKHGLIEQHGLTLAALFGKPVSLRITPAGVEEIERLNP